MGIGGSIISPEFFEEYLGMRVESVDEVEIIRRMTEEIYDEKEYRRALSWIKEKCRPDFDKNPPELQRTNERSQHMNKDKAMQMLKAKLLILREQENLAKESDIRGEVKEIGWGSQIRSYVMQPYTMVKDHRTNAETGNVSAVLDGDIDMFMNAYLKWINS